MPLHARPDDVKRFQRRFEYAFVQAGFYPPVAELVALGSDLAWGDARFRFVDQPHGGITSLGMRIDEGDKSAVYAIDFHNLTADMAKLYDGADIWICDCLMERPHPTHAHLDAVLGWARDLNVGQLYLTHMGNSMDYGTLAHLLPDWAAPAHDGLEISL